MEILSGISYLIQMMSYSHAEILSAFQTTARESQSAIDKVNSSFSDMGFSSAAQRYTRPTTSLAKSIMRRTFSGVKTNSDLLRVERLYVYSKGCAYCAC